MRMQGIRNVFLVLVGRVNSQMMKAYASDSISSMPYFVVRKPCRSIEKKRSSSVSTEATVAIIIQTSSSLRHVTNPANVGVDRAAAKQHRLQERRDRRLRVQRIVLRSFDHVKATLGQPPVTRGSCPDLG